MRQELAQGFDVQDSVVQVLSKPKALALDLVRANPELNPTERRERERSRRVVAFVFLDKSVLVFDGE